MEVFEKMRSRGYEQIVFCNDRASGLKAIIAIHDTTLGPALGGLRMWPYGSEKEALEDVCRLSRGMTYKAAVAGLNLGGGKGIVIGDPKRDKTETLFRAFGRFVQSLGGRYITAEDVGTTVEDMGYVRMETSFVTGISRALGGGGDPSPITALGVRHGIRACALERFGTKSLKGLRVVIQGLGQVGFHLCQLLYDEGVELTVTDIDRDKVRRAQEKFNATAVDEHKIYDVIADIFAPCALGGIINDQTIDRLKCPVVAGAANNQLEDGKVHGELLFKKGILYAPDYVINSGGLINVAHELQGYNREKAIADTERIYTILKTVFQISREENIPTSRASNRLAERRIKRIARLKHTYVGPAAQNWRYIN